MFHRTARRSENVSYTHLPVKAVREGASCFCRCEGYDLCFLAQRTRLEQKLYFSAGERYTDRIQALLQQCGIQSAIVEESDEMFATDREDWEIGTPVLDIVNSLLDEISYQMCIRDRI